MVKDPRLCMALMLTWGAFFLFMIYYFNNNKIDIKYGPYEGRTFLSIEIDSWGVWSFFAIIIMIDKFVNSISVDIIGSWLSNVVFDHKTEYLPYPTCICQTISSVYSFYFNLRYLITLQLLITQFDYSILRILADVIATYYSTSLHLKTKKYKND
jgi:hypothetical protein